MIYSERFLPDLQYLSNCLTVSKDIHYFKRLYLFIFRERGREGEREGQSINVWLPLAHPPLRTWPPVVCRPALNPLSHPSQGQRHAFYNENPIHTHRYIISLNDPPSWVFCAIFGGYSWPPRLISRPTKESWPRVRGSLYDMSPQKA